MLRPLTDWSTSSTDIMRPSPLEFEYVLIFGLLVTLALMVHLLKKQSVHMNMNMYMYMYI